MENQIKAAKNGRFGNKINVFLVLLRSEQLFETCGIELCYENNSARERLFSSAVNFKRKSRRTNEPVLSVANQAGRWNFHRALAMLRYNFGEILVVFHYHLHWFLHEIHFNSWRLKRIDFATSRHLITLDNTAFIACRQLSLFIGKACLQFLNIDKRVKSTQRILGHSLIRSLICSRCSLARLFRTACFAPLRTLAHWLPWQ